MGTEVRDVIDMLGLPPNRSGGEMIGEYARLSCGLNEYFRTLVDEDTDYTRFIERKQMHKEGVNQFAVKLRDLPCAQMSVMSPRRSDIAS